jgi:hypothetical protein
MVDDFMRILWLCVSAHFADRYQIEDVRGFVKRAAGQAGFEAFAEGGSNGGGGNL